MGSQGVGHDWATELRDYEIITSTPILLFLSSPNYNYWWDTEFPLELWAEKGQNLCYY